MTPQGYKSLQAVSLLRVEPLTRCCEQPPLEGSPVLPVVCMLQRCINQGLQLSQHLGH